MRVRTFYVQGNFTVIPGILSRCVRVRKMDNCSAIRVKKALVLNEREQPARWLLLPLYRFTVLGADWRVVCLVQRAARDGTAFRCEYTSNEPCDCFLALTLTQLMWAFIETRVIVLLRAQAVEM